MNLFTKLRHALLGRSQPKPTRLPAVDVGAMRIDELPPFTLKIAELMLYDPQVRIGLGARNGLLMAAEIEVAGPDAAIVRWVERQWNSLWHASAQQLLRAKLYGFVPFEVVFRRTAAGEFAGLLEVERLIDHHPGDVRLLVVDDQIVGFTRITRRKVRLPAKGWLWLAQPTTARRPNRATGRLTPPARLKTTPISSLPKPSSARSIRSAPIPMAAPCSRGPIRPGSRSGCRAARNGRCNCG